MFLSIFEIFKVGIGPSSSHTVGPMVAANRFLGFIKTHQAYQTVMRIRTSLHGSLAFTGKGHASDQAVMLGLMGHQADSIDPDAVSDLIDALHNHCQLELSDHAPVAFDPKTDIIFDYELALPHHANGMRFMAFDKQENCMVSEDYYSIGGGFVKTAQEIETDEDSSELSVNNVPYPFTTANQMLEMGQKSGLSIAEMKRQNECTIRSVEELEQGIEHLIKVMRDSIERGLNQQGILPGGLEVKRRANQIKQEIEQRKHANLTYPHDIMDHVSLFALAVNEENAAGGRIVTAPTNGASGIIPAVLSYYQDFCPKDTGEHKEMSHIFMLTAAAIGGLIKYNASISGAEVGCQGEVGSASAMAAAGLAAALGGTNEQIENAAEIALEHHLGMTCDPIGGLVQIPCIERNAMGAIKAINAASLALKGDGTHFVALDSAILTMKETGKDMLSKYKETSQGGLAVNGVAC